MKKTAFLITLLVSSLVTNHAQNINQQAAYSPNSHGSSYVSAQGYSHPMSIYSYSHPFNGAFWTGNGAHHVFYPQQYGNHPLGVVGNGMNNYGYPHFNPAYWNAQYAPQYPATIYPQHHQFPVPMHLPGYISGHVMHQGKVFHPGAFSSHFAPDQGIFSSKITKGLLGAVLVGTVAGIVARGK